ncbi:glucose-6-phosphate isomerase [Lentibacillus cibarius]|uniref:Glucose-6-phosphate isomerase n=1 Tax=Lentibacillus cibarius TaxID=2583219 RepID=A0A549YME9_9BACI|nr:glucose-6-phosphate isomerase [Lentibacillus cibarius]TRM13027.1 glucose-6-phosphate isomerase [Lentibacillus cibarius]
MTHISFSCTNAYQFFKQEEMDYLNDYIETAHYKLHENTGQGSDFLGWLDLPENMDKEEFTRIKTASKKIQNDSDVLLVIGIGGSYLGSRAAIDMLNHSFQNLLPGDKRQAPQIIFAGNHISSTYISELQDILENKDVSINVISKSGTTTEPAIAFRVFRKFLEDKYGKEEARKRIYATTDKEKGALKTVAEAEGYETFVIPDNVGGRYSVLTAVGLLPIAVSGIAIDEIIHGAKVAMNDLNEPKLANNPAYQYAAARNILYNKGKTTELLINYEPQLNMFSEWWKQLFGESEGKDQKGVFPASANFTTDLHSMGQYIQDGRRDLFETVLHINKPKKAIMVEEDTDNADGLNYLAGKTLHEINDKAYQGTLLAHTDGGVPNLVIEVPTLDAYTFGYLVYFFEKACAVSGYLLGVNPFDQPGVEAYKKNMFALLGKPGFEDEKEKLEKRLK